RPARRPSTVGAGDGGAERIRCASRREDPHPVRFLVCFSPQADLVGGVAITAIGIDACRHLRGRRSHLLLATLPLLLGIHQLIETFVWWGVEGAVPAAVGSVALWLYLLIAFVVLPTFVPV